MASSSFCQIRSGLDVGDDLRRVGRESDPRGVRSIAVLAGPVRSGLYRREAIKPAGKSRSSLDVASSEGVSHIVELIRVLQGEVRRPAALSFHELDIHFSDKIALAHESFTRLAGHVRLLCHVSSHFAVSGRYAVTTTAGDSCPAAIPQTT